VIAIAPAWWAAAVSRKRASSFEPAWATFRTIFKATVRGRAIWRAWPAQAEIAVAMAVRSLADGDDLPGIYAGESFTIAPAWRAAADP
jgi:hypothetical protein